MHLRFRVSCLHGWERFAYDYAACRSNVPLITNAMDEMVSGAGAWIYEYQSISSLAAKLALSGLVPDEDEEIIPPPELPPPLTPTWWCTAAQGVAVFVSCAFVVWFLLGLLLSTLELYTR